jgi:Flp pilus assembly pilin Flp
MSNRVRAGLVRTIVRSHDEDGQAMVEYALLISLIAIACFAILELLGVRLSHLYSSIVEQVPTP